MEALSSVKMSFSINIVWFTSNVLWRAQLYGKDARSEIVHKSSSSEKGVADGGDKKTATDGQEEDKTQGSTKEQCSRRQQYT